MYIQPNKSKFEDDQYSFDPIYSDIYHPYI